MQNQPSAGLQALKCPQCGGGLTPNGQESIVCPYCSSSLIFNHPAPGRSRPNASNEPVVRGMRLKPFSYTDTQGTGLEVFHMLAPSGWSFQGGCNWLLDNPGMPAVVAFALWNPQGAEAFEVLPNMNFTWNNNPLNRLLMKPGSRYFGAEVRPPVNIQEAFRSYILPRYRAQSQNLQIRNLTPLPDLPRLVKSDATITPGCSAQGGKARISYDWQGHPFEEEIYAVVEDFRVKIGSLFAPVDLSVWFIDYLFSFRAAAGRLDATADLFTVMIQSFKLNPHWYAAFKTVAQHMAQMQIDHINHIGEIGTILARAGSQARQQNLNEWYSRQEIFDRQAVDHSRSIRDVDGFFDPNRQEVVELPSGYGHAWANNLGEYVITDDASYNPNQESTQNWTPMETEAERRTR